MNMNRTHGILSRVFLTALCGAIFTIAICAQQRPGQLTVDYAAGEAPSVEEIAKVEAEVAAKPDDYELVRKLGKGYFFRFFGARDAAFKHERVSWPWINFGRLTSSVW